MTHKKTFLGQQNGFTLIELLITLVISLTALLGIGAAIYSFQKTHHAQEARATGVTLLNAVNGALLDSTLYSSDPLWNSALNSPNVDVAFPAINVSIGSKVQSDGTRKPITVSITPEQVIQQGTADVYSAVQQQPQYFDDEGKSCKTFGSEGTLNCDHAVRIALYNRAPAGSLPDWVYAKRVISSNGESPIVVKDRVATLTQDYSLSDFTTAIPNQFYANNVNYTCDTSHYGMNGMNASGQYVCLGQRPTTTANPAACVAGQLPIGVQFQGTNSTGDLVPVCAGAPTLICPLGYRLQGFNENLLYPGAVPNAGTTAQCVRDTVQSVSIDIVSTWDSQGVGGKISGTVCPQGYKLNSFDCHILPGSAAFKNGLCTNENIYGWNPPTTNSDGSESFTQIVSGSKTYSVSSVPGFAYGQVNTNTNSDVLCVAVVPPQLCTARWNALVEVTGTCDATTPEPIPATIQ